MGSRVTSGWLAPLAHASRRPGRFANPRDRRRVRRLCVVAGPAALSARQPASLGDGRRAVWQDEINNVALDQGLSIYAPLCTKEGHDIATARRRAISFHELVAFHRDVATQVGGEPDDTRP